MSEPVKRWEVFICPECGDVGQGPSLCDGWTDLHPTSHPERQMELSEVVAAADFDALLAERDKMQRLLHEARTMLADEIGRVAAENDVLKSELDDFTGELDRAFVERDAARADADKWHQAWVNQANHRDGVEAQFCADANWLRAIIGKIPQEQLGRILHAIKQETK